MIEKRLIRSINAKVSLLGFGLMRLPVVDNDKSRINYDEAQKLISKAFDAGVNYFDTAWTYHNGMSEVFVGDIFSNYPRTSYYLATKMPTWNLSPPCNIENLFNEQLKKCRTDYFDFYLAHSMDGEHLKYFCKNKLYDFLQDRKSDGQILRLGFSFHGNLDNLREIVDNFAWDFAQIQLNYIDWNAINAKQYYQFLTEKNIPIIVMEPLRGGALARLNENAATIFKNINSHFSLASWALRFVASLPNVMTVLSGMNAIEQLEDNIKTMSNFLALTEGELKIINKVVAIYQASNFIPCTGCNYCMDCPSGVNIPRVFNYYNSYKRHKSIALLRNDYLALLKEEQSDNCIECGQCCLRCPQKIDIPENMKEVSAMLTVLKNSLAWKEL